MKNQDYPVKKLNRKEFADALQKGLGRAYLHAAKYGIDEVADLILKACLHDQAYDPQSEPSKAKWLFNMFNNTQHIEKFSEAILSSLNTKKETWDLLQLFELAEEIALNGNESSREAIRQRAIRKASRKSMDDWLGARQWIELAGLDGAIELSRYYGRRLLRNPEDWPPENEIFPTDTIKSAFQIRLFEESKKEPTLKAYYEFLKTRGAFEPVTSDFKVNKEAAFERRREWVRQRYTLSSILDDARHNIDGYGIRYRLFGLYASQEELKTVYTQLLSETENAVRVHLLAVFDKVPFPQLNNELFLWANSENGPLRDASISSLSQVKDNRIHELAIEKLRRGEILKSDSGVLGLFVNNYMHEDAKLILKAAYQTKPSKEDAHRLVWDIIDLSKKSQDIGLVDVLKWAYEKTPCSSCRSGVVSQLIAFKQFDGEILHECQFDFNEDIVALAKNNNNE